MALHFAILDMGTLHFAMAGLTIWLKGAIILVSLQYHRVGHV
jgi:hypothetical protein